MTEANVQGSGDAVTSDAVTTDAVTTEAAGLAAEETLPAAEETVSAGEESARNGRSTGRSGSDVTELLVREGDIAGDYLEQLLDILDYDGDIDLDVENERAIVAVVGGSSLKSLVGQRGATLEALQELTRLAVLQQTGVRSRLMLDVAGYRARRRAELVAIGKNAAERVREQGSPVRLDPMNPFERKVVHDAVAQMSGVRSESEGEEPERSVVVLPAE